MGIGGKFWDLLKPHAHYEDLNFLRNKRVAVDLSYWIVQHRHAVPRARNPHLRNTFFRTVALFSKMGAYPVFVVDGEPSPMKTEARVERFFKLSGLDASEIENVVEGSTSKPRNRLFDRYVRECVELLRLLGMPVLEASSEAEALCAQLNREGLVDACITADSDAFLFGAKCVVKCFSSNSKEPFEVYSVLDIENALGLKRKQLIAIALLVGNDYDLHGVPGFGVDNAVRFVRLFSEDEVLHRLCDIGKGAIHVLDGISMPPDIADDSLHARVSHCSKCGHPGSKKDHLKIACDYCTSIGPGNCTEKPLGFRCICLSCDEGRKIKQQQKHNSWKIKVCNSISAQENFPNNSIIELYLCDNHRGHEENDDSSLKWDKPDVEGVVDFLTYHQHWQPSYIKQRMLSMLSTIYLREMTCNPNGKLLLYDQYEFHSIQRVKILHGHQYYLVKWKKAADNTILHVSDPENSELEQIELAPASNSVDLLDEPDAPDVLIDDGCTFLLTDENMDLVQSAFPKEVEKFTEQKRSTKSKLKECKDVRTGVDGKSTSPKSSGVQRNITEFYRSSKILAQPKSENSAKNSLTEPPPGNEKRSADGDGSLSKTVRRRLLFD